MSSCPHTKLTRPECHCQACSRAMIANFAPHLAEGHGAVDADAADGLAAGTSSSH